MLKEFLVMLVELFFEIDSSKDYSAKQLLIVFFKVLAFILVLIIVLYFLLNKEETVTISSIMLPF